MSESSKWKKQKRSPRPPRHLVRSPSGQMEAAQPSLSNNLSGKSLPPDPPGLSSTLLMSTPADVHCLLPPQEGSPSLSKACPPPACLLQKVLAPPSLVLWRRTVAWRRVPKPPPEKTSLTWTSVVPLQSAPTELPLLLGLSLALQRHRYPLYSHPMKPPPPPTPHCSICPLFLSSLRVHGSTQLQLRWSPSQRFWKTKTPSESRWTVALSMTWTMSTPAESGSPSPPRETVTA